MAPLSLLHLIGDAYSQNDLSGRPGSRIALAIVVIEMGNRAGWLAVYRSRPAVERSPPASHNSKTRLITVCVLRFVLSF